MRSTWRIGSLPNGVVRWKSYLDAARRPKSKSDLRRLGDIVDQIKGSLVKEEDQRSE